VVSASFDEPNLVSSANLVPLMGLACRTGPQGLADEHVPVPTDKGANPALTLSSLVAGTAMVDIDDTLVEVHSYQKQGAGFGYSGVRCLNALLSTISTDTSAPVIAAQRLRTSVVGSPRGAARLTTDTLALVRRTHLTGRDVLIRVDSVFYGAASVGAATRTGARVSITVRMDRAVKRDISTIDTDAWTSIQNTDAIFEETTATWISRAEVAEVDFTAFTLRKKSEQVPERIVMRRIPDLNAHEHDGQAR
jgi:hypothetical protein